MKVERLRLNGFCEWESVWNGMKPRRDCVEMEWELAAKGKIGCVCGVLCMKMRCDFCV